MYINKFEFLLALLGGLLIALSTTLNLYLKGRITGMSGLISGIINYNQSHWKISIISGILVTTCIFWLIFKFEKIKNTETYIFPTPEQQLKDLNIFGFALSGFLVGIGTKLGNGCTSGHGVCGLPRLSIRSYVAVCIFMIFAVLTCTLRYYFPFWNITEGINVIKKINYDILMPIILVIVLVFYIVYCFYYYKNFEKPQISELLISFLIGSLFASGLIFSGMIKREKICNFLTIQMDIWDPSLMIVMASACLPNFISFHYILKQPKPLFQEQFSVPPKGKVDLKLIMGAILFGIGWGFGGLCPGPSYVSFAVFSPHISVVFVGSLIIGNYLVDKINEIKQEKVQTDEIELIKKK